MGIGMTAAMLQQELSTSGMTRAESDESSGLHHLLSTYGHDFLVLRAAVLIRRFPLAQRCRLRDLSVRMNFGRYDAACTEASSTVAIVRDVCSRMLGEL